MDQSLEERLPSLTQVRDADGQPLERAYGQLRRITIGVKSAATATLFQRRTRRLLTVQPLSSAS